MKGIPLFLLIVFHTYNLCVSWTVAFTHHFWPIVTY